MWSRSVRSAASSTVVPAADGPTDAVHMDVAFICLAVIWYALIPKQTNVVKDDRVALREQLMDRDEVELALRGPDQLPKGNPFIGDNDGDDDGDDRRSSEEGYGKPLVH